MASTLMEDVHQREAIEMPTGTHCLRPSDIAVHRVRGVEIGTHNDSARIDPGRLTDDCSGRVERGEDAVAQLQFTGQSFTLPS
jgi:hypothetical protein